jgi:hypothetical protein
LAPEDWPSGFLADKDANDGYGTLSYRNRWFTFDQIAVSLAMLDGNDWTVVPDSVQTINTPVRRGDRHKRPWRFGNPKDPFERGYSDHFPVTVPLKVPGGWEAPPHPGGIGWEAARSVGETRRSGIRDR